jgi:3-isopropylmalate/(R)-2-methylmalate dehydratase small subunit
VRAFGCLTAVAAPLPLANIDTDKILPGRFLKTVRRDGLGTALFDTMRFDDAGREKPDFILNREPWRNAQILIARGNFGCGSSREHAPWALTDFGFRCVIAPSFADIFYNNCFKNGILPIVLDEQTVELLLDGAMSAQTATLTVDLLQQIVRRSDGTSLPFEIAPERKRVLELGLDDIAETLELVSAIDAFEAGYRTHGAGIAAGVATLFPPRQ